MELIQSSVWAEWGVLVDCEYVVRMADRKRGKRVLKVKDELCKRTSDVTDYLGRSACRLFFIHCFDAPLRHDRNYVTSRSLSLIRHTPSPTAWPTYLPSPSKFLPLSFLRPHFLPSTFPLSYPFPHLFVHMIYEHWLTTLSYPDHQM